MRSKKERQVEMLSDKVIRPDGKDRQRKILIGAAALDKAERDPEFKKWLDGLLDRSLSKTRDRAAFGLPPRTASQVPAELVPLPTSEMEDA